MEVVNDARNGHVDNGQVEQGHEQTQREHRQRQPRRRGSTMFNHGFLLQSTTFRFDKEPAQLPGHACRLSAPIGIT